MSNPDLTLSHAQDLAAKLARNMHLPAHVVNDCGHLLICDDHDILTWGTDQIVYTVDPEQAFSSAEMDPPGPNIEDDSEGDRSPPDRPRCLNTDCNGAHHTWQCPQIYALLLAEPVALVLDVEYAPCG